MHYELVLVDQSQLRQRQRELHASHEQSLSRLPLELLNGLPEVPAYELRVPIDPVQGARHHVLLRRVDRPGEGLHPLRPRSRLRRRPKRGLHHFVSHPAEEEGVGPVEVLDRVTMQVFVRGHCSMIAAPVQCDVDGIPEGSHYAKRTADGMAWQTLPFTLAPSGTDAYDSRDLPCARVTRRFPSQLRRTVTGSPTVYALRRKGTSRSVVQPGSVQRMKRMAARKGATLSPKKGVVNNPTSPPTSWLRVIGSSRREVWLPSNVLRSCGRGVRRSRAAPQQSISRGCRRANAAPAAN